MNIKEIKDLISFISKSDIKEFQYENDNESIFISKNGDAPQIIQGMPQMQYAPQAFPAAPAAAAAAVPAAAVPAAAPVVSGTEVKSPIVGTFYESPSPGAAPFASEGETIKKGQTLCIIEAMKIMNEIEAEFDCIIKKRVGMNGKPVEYGETIFIVEPI